MFLKVIHVGIVHGGAVGCDDDYEEEEYYYYHDIIVTIVIMIIFLSCSCSLLILVSIISILNSLCVLQDAPPSSADASHVSSPNAF